MKHFGRIKINNMATCKKCGQSNLHWVQDQNGRWKLYNASTGNPHDSCKMTSLEYAAIKKETRVCKHGILKDHPCDMCENEL